MRVPWKLIGLASLAGVAATGVVVARRKRASTTPSTSRDELGREAAPAPAEVSAREPER